MPLHAEATVHMWTYAHATYNIYTTSHTHMKNKKNRIVAAGNSGVKVIALPLAGGSDRAVIHLHSHFLSLSFGSGNWI